MGCWISTIQQIFFKEEKLTSDGPDWRNIAEGINFQGICRNSSCKANNEFVMIQKGFYDSTDGTCKLNYGVTRLECPACKQTLDKNEVHGIGVYKAKLQVKTKTRGHKEVVVNVDAKDKYLHSQCIDDLVKVNNGYSTLIVERC